MLLAGWVDRETVTEASIGLGSMSLTALLEGQVGVVDLFSSVDIL